jgi:hypothetical protein
MMPSYNKFSKAWCVVFFFQLTMINNVEPMMAKTRDKNLVSKLWSSPIMAHKLSECIKLDEIVLT